MKKESKESKQLEARRKLVRAFEEFYNLPEIKETVSKEHSARSPDRIVDALFEMTSGCWRNPVDILQVMFDGKTYDEVIFYNDISFVSLCQHHALPFFGKAHFAYLPKDHIVGLSKIPRLVECYARRLQIQEQLGQSIVDTFMHVVRPWGCGIVTEAWHMCAMIRGANQRPGYAKTSALRGTFKDNEPIRREFLDGVRRVAGTIWP